MKRSLIFSFIFFIIILLSASIISSHKDAQGEKISFGDWLKNLWGKITGQQTLQLQRGAELCRSIDADGDGYLSTASDCPVVVYDCNDNNPAIKPGAAEICDGVDNNCDGSLMTNENTDSTGTENCLDNIDNDCDGLVNELCQQFPLSCPNPPACTPLNSKQCSGSSGYKTCSPNPNNCLVWSTTVTACPNGGTCSGLGVCSVEVEEPINCIGIEPINWTKTITECGEGDTYINYYLNATEILPQQIGCPPRPANETFNCDYNENNLICESFPGIESVGINGLLLNVSKNYTNIGIGLVELAQPGSGGVDFNWNFANPLNFCNISVEVADSSADYGYTIVRNAGVSNKTVWVERLNNSNKICVKDIPGVASISEFSSRCNGNNEVLVSCPSGVSSAYKCEIVLDAPPSKLSWFKVWPLNHSAVKEISSLITGSLLIGEACQENWNCTNWTDVNDIGEGCGARTCNDSESCGTILDKPLEIKSCISEGECTPSWTCTGYGKCVDGFKERVCTDSEGCEIETNKPSEISECKGKSSILVIILAVVGLILLIFLILYFMKRKSSGEEEPSETQAPASPPSPPRPPANVYNPRPQYAQPYIQR